MAFLTWTRTLWRNLRHRERIEQELDDELNATLELLAEEKRRAGLPDEHARRAAAVELRIEPVKERVRDVRVGVTLETVTQDLRYAWRHIRRAPGFALAIVVTLALGIGASTGVFSLLNTLTLQRVPVVDPDGLIAIAPRTSRGLPRSTPISAIDVLARDGPLEHLCGYLGAVILPVLANGAPAERSVTFVTGQCFNAFGIVPTLGRPITDDDAPIYGPGHASPSSATGYGRMLSIVTQQFLTERSSSTTSKWRSLACCHLGSGDSRSIRASMSSRRSTL